MMVESAANDAKAAVTPCWSCKGPVAARALFCSTCGAVQPPGEADAFTRLGLRRVWDLAPADLDRQYFGFQRRLHPDRFATKSSREKALAQLQASALNEAYEALKDPVQRAALLLRLAGHDLDIDGAATIDDPALLTEAMALREALMEADSADEVNRLAADAESEIAATQAALEAAFSAEDYEKAGNLVLRLRYMIRLADEIRARRARRALPTS
jgi:molecular chaperone HscB